MCCDMLSHIIICCVLRDMMCCDGLEICRQFVDVLWHGVL